MQLQGKVISISFALPLTNPILSFSRSNCDSEVRAELRRHYSKPYFIPSDSEHSEIDWIFMGGVGPGANIHVRISECWSNVLEHHFLGCYKNSHEDLTCIRAIFKFSYNIIFNPALGSFNFSQISIISKILIIYNQNKPSCEVLKFE